MSAIPDTEAVLSLCRHEPRRPLEEVLHHFPGHEEHVARIWFASVDTTEAATAPLAAGDRIGPYVRLRTLGSGAQGEVLLARDSRSQRLVALKVLSGRPTSHAIQRLRHEAQAIARLRHPAFAEVLDVETDAAKPFLVMRHVEGIVLREARIGGPVALFATAEDPEPTAALRWFEDLARAIHVAHEAGVVHADLHPGNLMVAANGNPVVLDFGTAKVEGLVTITQTGLALGSTRFAAPEVLRGQRADRRSDVFSLAAVMIDCLSLAASASDLQQALAGVAATSVRTVLGKAVATVPADRFASAQAFADELRRIRVGEPIRTGSPTALRRLTRGIARNPLPLMAAAALSAALVLALVTWRGTLLAQERQDAAAAHGRALMTDLAAEWSTASIDQRVLVGSRTGASAADDELLAGVEFEVGRILRRSGRDAAAWTHLQTATNHATTASRARFESGLIAFERGLDVDTVREANEPSDAFLCGLCALHRGEIADGMDRLATAVQRQGWAEPLQREEAIALVSWLASDSDAADRRLQSLPALAPDSPGVMGSLAKLLRFRVALAAGNIDEALAGLRQARTELARQLGDNHAWTLRAERAVAAALAANGEHWFAATVLAGMLPPQTAIHGRAHPEVVTSLLLHRDCLRLAGRAEAEAAEREVNSVVVTAANRHVLASARPVEAAATVKRKVKLRIDHVAAFEAEYRRQRDIRLSLEAQVESLPEGEQATLHQAARRQWLLVEEAAHAALDRAKFGSTHANYLGLLTWTVEECMRSGFDAEGLVPARKAMGIVLDHPEEVDRVSQLRVQSMFCKATLSARARETKQPLPVAASLDLFAEMRPMIAEMRALVGDRDPRFLEVAKNLADALCNHGGPEHAREAVPLYETLRTADPEVFEPTCWVAEAALQAGDAALAEPHVAKLGQILGKRPAATTDWRWPIYDTIVSDLAKQKARSQQVGR
jgi:eukaryotic-like serine/threonine-protein kinase